MLYSSSSGRFAFLGARNANGLPHGKGTYTYSNNTKYEGDWVNGKKHGKGTFHFANGGRYEGDWVNDKAHGKAIFYHADGSRYEGDYKEDCAWGVGTLYCKNGNRYEGDWVKSKMKGQGKYFYKNGDLYEGEFRDSKMNGEGVHKYSNGNLYKGLFKDGLYDGLGEFSYHTGNVFKGQYSKGKMHGRGRMTYVDDGEVYEGEYRNNRRTGFGKYTYENGDRYEGEWKDDMRDGNGTLLCKNGGKYVGIYKEDRKHGPGTFYYKSGARNGKRDGKGKMFKQMGEVIERVYQNGTLVGESIITSKKKSRKKKVVGERKGPSSSSGFDFEKFNIEYKSIEKGKKLGRGGFGTVYSGVWNGKGGGIEIAYKKIDLLDSFNLEENLEEFRIIMECHHPLVLSVYGYSISPDRKRLKIVMERMHCDVFGHVKKNSISIKKKLEIMKKMAQCVHYLHSEGIIHRDIKCQNFLIDENGKVVKITDFGLAKFASNSATFLRSDPKGTQIWMAPELFQVNAQFSVYSDVYALAMAYVEILNEEIPFKKEMDSGKINPFAIGSHIRDGARPSITNDPNIPKIVLSLLKRCWKDNPRDRLNTKTILEIFEKV